jgi:hypothetical protein
VRGALSDTIWASGFIHVKGERVKLERLFDRDMGMLPPDLFANLSYLLLVAVTLRYRPAFSSLVALLA